MLGHSGREGGGRGGRVRLSRTGRESGECHMTCCGASVKVFVVQEFGFSEHGELQFEEDLCLDLSSTSEKAHIHIQSCHGLGGNQKWIYNNQVVQRLFC